MQKLSINSFGDVYKEIKSYIHQIIPTSFTIKDKTMIMREIVKFFVCFKYAFLYCNAVCTTDVKQVEQVAANQRQEC